MGAMSSRISDLKNLNFDEDARSEHLNNSNNYNDQSYYSIKILSIFSQINQFQPDYWSLVNAQDAHMVNKVYLQIKKKIKTLKELITCFYRVS